MMPYPKPFDLPNADQNRPENFIIIPGSYQVWQTKFGRKTIINWKYGEKPNVSPP